MNTAPVCAGFDPALRLTRRLLLQQIAIEGAGAFNVRAERVVLRGMFNGWTERAIEKLLERLLRRAAGTPAMPLSHRRSGGRSLVSLARANGWDQPVGGAALPPSRARGAHDPKTPAATAPFIRVAGRSTCAASCGATLQRGSREVVA